MRHTYGSIVTLIIESGISYISLSNTHTHSVLLHIHEHPQLIIIHANTQDKETVINKMTSKVTVTDRQTRAAPVDSWQPAAMWSYPSKGFWSMVLTEVTHDWCSFLATIPVSFNLHYIIYALIIISQWYARDSSE